jgi:hypothetical protein
VPKRDPHLQGFLGGRARRLPLVAGLALSLGVMLFLAVCVAAGGEGVPPPPARPRLVTLKGIRYDLEAKRVIMEGRVALTSGVVELLACVRGTKDYESVLALDCQPYDLHLGLLALGLEPGRPVSGELEFYHVQKREEPAGPPRGPTVVVWVEWKDREGRTVRHRAEELVTNVKTKKTMELTGWVFVGSRFVRDEASGKEVYAAVLTGAVITTYHDPTTVLDNPSTTGEDDTLFEANQADLPPVGTPVQVIVEPEKKKDVSPDR